MKSIVSITSRVATALVVFWPLVAVAEKVTLSSATDGIELTGELIEFKDGVYRIETVIGEIAIRAEQVTCSGPGCPETSEPAPELRAIPGEKVTIITDNGAVSLSGILVSFEDGAYEIDTDIGRLEILAEGTVCEGPGCPVPVAPRDTAVAITNVAAQPTEVVEDTGLTEILPVDTDFEVPLAALSGEPTITLSGAASVIEALLPAVADMLVETSGETVEVASTEATAYVTAAEAGAPAGSLGLRLAPAEGDGRTILANLTSGVEAADGADISFLTGPVGAGSGPGDLIGVEALVPVVSRQNPIFAITAQDLGRVFAGGIANWDQIGGPDQPIRVLGLAPPHDLTTALQTQILGPQGRTVTPDIERLPTTADLLAAVAEDSSAIAFVGASQAGEAKKLSIADSCGTPVAATPGSVKSGRYPFARELRVVAGGSDDLTGALLASLDIFIRDTARSGLIVPGTASYPLDAEIGQIRDSLNRIEDRRERQNAANALRMMSVAEKLSLDIRFEPGTNRFSGDTAAGIAEILGFAGDKGLPELFLVGFSEDTGSVERNHEMGRNAAQLLADQLREADSGGVLDETLIRTIGLGAITPIACDDGSEATNRRVEIWIRG